MKKKWQDDALGKTIPGVVKILLKMKLTLCVILISVFGTMASESYSQTTKLSLDLKKAKVKDALGAIENQSEFYFLYSEKLINVDREVNIEVQGSTIEKILDKIFEGTNVNYTVKGRQIVLATPEANNIGVPSSVIQQQGKKVTGKVTDSSGEYLPGVSIVVKGTTNGVITDNNGIYSLANIPENATLQFSFVGMKTQEIKVGTQSTLNVVMEDEAIGLEEVVAIGYGTVKKETLTGSVANITSASIISTKSENLISNIQGKVSGLMVRQLTGEPGKFNNYVSIRGFGAPLVIVDGIVRDGTADMAQINSNDIESMSVLKDAAASIYGMNAANGVIIITTKKGSEGKAQFSYSNLFGMKSATGMEHTVDAYTYRVMKNEMDRNSGATETYTSDILEKYRTGVDGYQDVDWINLTLKPQVFQQSHNFSVKGGTKNVKYFNSFGYTEDNGLLTSGIQYYRRYNFRSTTTADLM